MKDEGLWNGGLVPLGCVYSPEEKKLKINPEEAEVVRLAFETYLKEKSLGKVVKTLNSLGYRTKTHKTKSGKIIGGNEVIITSLRHILTNPIYIYIGHVKHKGKIYKSPHPAIIDK